MYSLICFSFEIHSIWILGDFNNIQRIWKFLFNAQLSADYACLCIDIQTEYLWLCEVNVPNIWVFHAPIKETKRAGMHFSKLQDHLQKSLTYFLREENDLNAGSYHVICRLVIPGAVKNLWLIEIVFQQQRHLQHQLYQQELPSVHQLSH